MNVYLVRTSEDLGLRSKRRATYVQVIVASSEELALEQARGSGFESIVRIDPDEANVAFTSVS